MMHSRRDPSWMNPRWPMFVILMALLTCYSLTAKGQASETQIPASSTELAEVKIPLIHTVNSRKPGFGYCGTYSRTVGPVVSEDEFRDILQGRPDASDKDRCAFLSRLKVDFNQHTVLTYRVNGDCFVSARAQVFRNDSSRRYVLRITKRYGGCRAAGSFEEWLVIEKIRPDYEVEVQLFAQDESGETRRRDQR